MSILRVAMLAAAAGLASLASAQTYPTKPIRFIVQFGPGSTLDIMARLLGPHMHQSLGQPVVVENRPGAGGMVGTELAARSPPDGHTLTMGALGPLATNPALYPMTPIDPVRDFAAITLLGTGPVLIVVHPSVPARTLKALVALARSKPGQLVYGSTGVGSSPHLAGELFTIVTGTKLVHVPYKGNAEALTDLVGGQVSIVFSGVPPVVPFVQTGKVRALATTGKRRLDTMPEVETVGEAGWPGAEVLIWYGIVAPAATPRAVIDRLNAEIVRIMALPDVRARFAQLGVDPATSTPDAFATLIRDEYARWTKVIRTADIRIE